MTRTKLAATEHPTTAREALEVLEILVRAYVPKNTSDAAYCLAALNVMRRTVAPVSEEQAWKAVGARIITEMADRKKKEDALPAGACRLCLGEGELGSMESQRIMACPDCNGTGRSAS